MNRDCKREGKSNSKKCAKKNSNALGWKAHNYDTMQPMPFWRWAPKKERKYTLLKIWTDTPVFQYCIPALSNWDPSLGTVQHSRPIVDGRHWEISLCVMVTTLSTRKSCVPLLMAVQTHWLYYGEAKVC